MDIKYGDTKMSKIKPLASSTSQLRSVVLNRG